MDKLTMAHEYALKQMESLSENSTMQSLVSVAWQYADAMQAEAEKRNKAEAAQKRKEIREMLNSPNTFVEREGQHFDDLTPTWDQGPNVLTAEDAEKYKNMIKREFDLYNNPQPKIEKRKYIHAEALREVDWRVAPEWAKYHQDGLNGYIWVCENFEKIEEAPSFGFTGSHIVERPHGF